MYKKTVVRRRSQLKDTILVAWNETVSLLLLFAAAAAGKANTCTMYTTIGLEFKLIVQKMGVFSISHCVCTYIFVMVLCLCICMPPICNLKISLITRRLVDKTQPITHSQTKRANDTRTQSMHHILVNTGRHRGKEGNYLRTGALALSRFAEYNLHDGRLLCALGKSFRKWTDHCCCCWCMSVWPGGGTTTNWIWLTGALDCDVHR